MENPIAPPLADQDVKECRICGESDETESKLFSPCRCRGSSRYIHVSCLQQWRVISINPRSKYQCGTCMYEYNIGRIWYASIIASPITVSAVTLVAITLSVGIVAYIFKYGALFLFGAKYGRSAWMLSRQLIWWAMLSIGLVTMVVILFASDNPPDLGGMFNAPVYHHHGPIAIQTPAESYILFEIAGYAFSLGGFGIFVAGVYHSVRIRCDQILASTRQVILEVE